MNANETSSTPSRLWKWRIKNTRSCPDPEPQVDEAAVFGQPLDCSISSDDSYVPLILQLCVKVVEKHGLNTVGVYRIPGNSAAVNFLMTSLNKGFGQVDFTDTRWLDVNVVSSLLKAYLRKLPDPLLTNRLYAAFIEANRTPGHEQQLMKIKKLVDRLPKHNYETLRYLILHLQKVVQHSNVNKMDCKNLATIFGPSLLGPSGSGVTHMITHVSDQCKLVEKLIFYASWLFLEPEGTPIPPAGIAPNGQGPSASFADMSDLLRRVSRTEDDLEKTKENIMRSLVQVGGRRKSRQKDRKESVDMACSISSEPGLLDVPDLVAEDGVFNERNIDDAIASSRRRRISEGSVTPNGSVAPNHANELALAAEALRKKRECDIYAARRIFIAGTEANEIIRNALTDSTAGIGHSPLSAHVVSTTSVLSEVLSPETREKLRQYQSDGRTFRPLESHKRPSDVAARITPQSYVPRENSHETRLESSRHSILGASGDSLSMTSDYSTTSSTLGCELHASTSSAGTNATPANISAAAKQPSLGHLSDYSSNASPTTPRLLTPNVAPTQMSSSVSSTSSKRHSSPEPNFAKTPQPHTLSPVDSTEDTSEPPWYEVDGMVADAAPIRDVPAEEPIVKPMPHSEEDGHVKQPERNGRIAQRIRFRHRHSLTSADKRKDNRRHTVANHADLETLQSVIDDSLNNTSKDLTPQCDTNKNVSNDEKSFQRTGSVKLIFRRDRSTSKSAPEKVRAWFRESFRKSSQELDDAPVAEEGPPVIAATQV